MRVKNRHKRCNLTDHIEYVFEYGDSSGGSSTDYFGISFDISKQSDKNFSLEFSIIILNRLLSLELCHYIYNRKFYLSNHKESRSYYPGAIKE